MDVAWDLINGPNPKNDTQCKGRKTKTKNLIATKLKPTLLNCFHNTLKDSSVLTDDLFLVKLGILADTI